MPKFKPQWMHHNWGVSLLNIYTQISLAWNTIRNTTMKNDLKIKLRLFFIKTYCMSTRFKIWELLLKKSDIKWISIFFLGLKKHNYEVIKVNLIKSVQWSSQEIHKFNIY